MLDANSSEIDGGTAAFKMLPWFDYALLSFPGARFISRVDDDVYLEVPALVATIEALAQPHGDEAFLLAGAIAKRAFWSPALRTSVMDWGRGNQPSDARGPFPFANGMFFALSAPAARALCACRAAHDYVSELLHLTLGPFVATADDGL